jgi:hypothetical protein
MDVSHGLNLIYFLLHLPILSKMSVKYISMHILSLSLTENSNYANGSRKVELLLERKKTTETHFQMCHKFHVNTESHKFVIVEWQQSFFFCTLLLPLCVCVEMR